LANRFYESNNLWRPCADGPAESTATYNYTTCKTRLKALGIPDNQFPADPGSTAGQKLAADQSKPTSNSYTLGQLQAAGACAFVPPAPSGSAAKKDITVSQAITVTSVTLSSYAGDVKLVYEGAYALSIGIWDTTTNKYKTGCNVTSNATAVRRAGVKIAFVATVNAANAYTAQTLSASSTVKSSLVSAVSTVNTALAKSVTAPSAAAITVAAPTAMNNDGSGPAPSPGSPSPSPTPSSSSSDDSSSTMLIIIIAAAVVVVGAAVACYVMAGGKESATEKMVITAPPSMGEEHALTVEKEAAPPGAVYMKNGVWLDADGNPVE